MTPRHAAATARLRRPGTSSSSSSVTNVAPAAARSARIARAARRLLPRPAVEQQDGAVAVRERARRRRRRLSAGSAAPPSRWRPRASRRRRSPARRAGRRRARARARRRTGSGTTAAGRRPVAGADRGLRRPRRRGRCPAAVSIVSRAWWCEWLPTRWPSAAIRRASAGSASAQRPWTKNVAGAPAAARASRMPGRDAGLGRPVGVLGVDRERDAERRAVPDPLTSRPR